MTSFDGVAELGGETVAGAIVVVLAVLIARRATGRGVTARPIIAASLAGLLALSVALHLRGVGSALAQSGRGHVSAQTGLESCVNESLSGAPVAPRAVGFLAWVKRRLPDGARYVVSPYEGLPDGWCLTTVLLPALPATGAERFEWTLALGSIPAEMQAKIAHHDPNVRVYSPGYALEFDRQP